MRNEEWMHIAKRLAVGQGGRFRHGREDRMNLTVRNEPDRYWAWCHRCHEGGTVMKEHVLLNAPIEESVSCEWPKDAVRIQGTEYEEIVAKFLANKGMDLMFLRDVLYSPKSKRILLDLRGGLRDNGIHGRDITGRSATKWMNYLNTQVVGELPWRQPAVVVEDLFSMFKVQYAMRGSPFQVVCALGTNVGHTLRSMLVDASSIIWFFDNDNAGDAGANTGMVRMRPWDIPQYRVSPPQVGDDPKDMDLGTIREMLCNVL